MASTTVDPAAVTLEVLNQFSNYKRWSLAVENYLVAEDLWGVVKNNEINPRDNARALRIIQNCCGAYNFNFIRESRSAKEAWETLAKQFEPVYSDIPVKSKTVRPAIIGNLAVKSKIVGPPINCMVPNMIPNMTPMLGVSKNCTAQSPWATTDPAINNFSYSMTPMLGASKACTAQSPCASSSLFQKAQPSALPAQFQPRPPSPQVCPAVTQLPARMAAGPAQLPESMDWSPFSNQAMPCSDQKIPCSGEGSSDTAMDDGVTRHPTIKKKDLDSGKEEIKGTTDNANLKDFFKDVESFNWHEVMEFLKNNRSAVREEIPKLRYSVLHHAVLNPNDTDIVNNLVDLMNEDELIKMTDKDGCTALDYAVKEDKIEMVKCMVTKCKKLTSIGNSDGWLPVLVAYSWDKFKIARYLYRNTPIEDLKSQSGAQLISQSFSKKGPKETKIAWQLINDCPGLVVATNHFGHSPLNVLAGMRCAFLSGEQLEFWEYWVYKCMQIKPFKVTVDNSFHTIEILTHSPPNNKLEKVMGSFRLITSFLKLLTSFLKLWSSGKRIYEMKSHHAQSRAFLNIMSEVVSTKKKYLNEMQLRFVQSAIFRAVERGHIEFVTRMLKKDPGFAILKDANGMNMFQYAVECRQEKIYSLFYKFKPEERIHFVEGCVDKLNNSLLHVVGRLPPYPQLDRIQDAALRMQRELQWFKEVESIVPRTPSDLLNITDNMTAHELFKKNHKELMKEAEKSMKGTATSCTVVGSLIITMTFAAAFTVPGGNKGDTGIPLFLYENWFMFFIASDAFSLFSSTTSVIIFLGILTSRYAEDDFLKSLPRKMIFGLVFLFLSILTMMIAFYSAVYIMLKGRITGTGISVILLGCCFPVVTFILMQFRLLKEMVVSTYGAGIFKKNVEQSYSIHQNPTLTQV